MAITVALVGIRDRKLEEALRASGKTVATIPLTELSALTGNAAAADAIVVDLRDHTQLPPSIALLKRQRPSSGIAIVVSTLDPAIILSAMRAGVTECVTALSEIEAAVDRLMAHRTAAHAGEVYAFIGAKGGVGTTTAAVNVAAALVKVAPTLLMDLHSVGGDAALLLGAEPRFSVLDALENTYRLDAALFRGVLAHSKYGVDLLASPDRGTARIDGASARTLVEFAAQQYRYVILDVSRSDPATLDILEAATKIVVVANQELAAVRSAGRLTSLLAERYGKPRIHVVVGRADRQSEILHGDIERTVGFGVQHAFPSDYRTARDAMNHGEPIVIANGTALASAYRAYANDLAGLKSERKQAEPRPGGLLGLLTGRRQGA